MDRFFNLSRTLQELDTTANEILGASVQLMKEMAEADSELIEDIQFLVTTGKVPVTSNQAADRAHELIIPLLSNAEAVKREIKNFIKSSTKGFTINDAECPFFAQIWNGDMYDETEVAGLTELLKDLRSQLKKLNYNAFVRDCAASLST